MDAFILIVLVCLLAASRTAFGLKILCCLSTLACRSLRAVTTSPYASRLFPALAFAFVLFSRHHLYAEIVNGLAITFPILLAAYLLVKHMDESAALAPPTVDLLAQLKEAHLSASRLSNLLASSDEALASILEASSNKDILLGELRGQLAHLHSENEQKNRGWAHTTSVLKREQQRREMYTDEIIRLRQRLMESTTHIGFLARWRHKNEVHGLKERIRELERRVGEISDQAMKKVEGVIQEAQAEKEELQKACEIRVLHVREQEKEAGEEALDDHWKETKDKVEGLERVVRIRDAQLEDRETTLEEVREQNRFLEEEIEKLKGKGGLEERTIEADADEIEVETWKVEKANRPNREDIEKLKDKGGLEEQTMQACADEMEVETWKVEKANQPEEESQKLLEQENEQMQLGLQEEGHLGQTIKEKERMQDEEELREAEECFEGLSDNDDDI